MRTRTLRTAELLPADFRIEFESSLNRRLNPEGSNLERLLPVNVIYPRVGNAEHKIAQRMDRFCAAVTSGPGPF
jgi:hypothetical protein